MSNEKYETVSVEGVVVRGVKLVCPFYGKVVHIGYNANGDGAIDHELPPCEKFIELDSIEYTRTVRLKLSS